MAKTNNNELKEELSDKTLELMLFREMILNKDFLGRFSEVADFRWFRTPHVKVMAEIAVSYYRKYGSLVTKDLIESVITRKNETQVIEANKIDLQSALFDFNKAKDIDLGSMEPVVKIDKITRYVKQEALRNSLLDAATNLENNGTDKIIEDTLGKFEDIQRILFEDLDFGYEFSSEKVEDSVEEHITYLTNPDAKISTGWNCLDGMTKGGFLRDGKSMYIFMAQAGLGKSNVLSNLGYNFLKQDLKVLVISMEMSKNVYMRRFDSLISKIDIDDLGIASMSETLKTKLISFFKVEHPNARLMIKEFPPNSINSLNIDQYIEKMVETQGWKPDVLIVDYLGLINPRSGGKGKDSNMYEDGSATAKDIRALSYKYGIPIVTAVQCNSSGFDTADISMANIAESRAIAHHTDFLVGLYQTEDEQVDGIFHMKILKNRFGDKTNMRFEFNKNTMEFTDINDIPDNAGTSTGTVDSSSSSILPKCSQIDDMDAEIFGDSLGMP